MLDPRKLLVPTSKRRCIGRPPVERRGPPEPSRRGVALIMVLAITTILTMLAADLKNETQVNLQAAANARDQLQAHFHARSALELEFFVLRFQSSIKKTLGKFIPIPLFELSTVLVSSDTVKGLLSEGADDEDDPARADRSFALSQPFGDFQGAFEIEEVVDENRKINLNGSGFGVGCQNFLHRLLAAVFDDPRYDPLFENVGESRDPLRNRIEVIANITDWIDGNETVDPVCIVTGDRSQGGTTEDTRYNHLPYNVSYRPKNGMMNSVEELRMVRGVNSAFMRLFADYFTVWSDTAGISMQTAEPFMIRALIRAIQTGPPRPGDEERLERFEEARALLMAMPPPLNRLSLTSFKQLLDTAQIAYDPQKLTQLEQKKFIRFDDISSVYRITAVGRVNRAESRISVVWRDNRARGEIYYWREE